MKEMNVDERQKAEQETRSRIGLKDDYEEEKKGERNKMKCKRFLIFK
jgi:hypothetical protein